MLKKGGYQSVQVAMEAKSAVSSDHSTHTQFWIGVGDRADGSEVVDGTPDFYARSISIHSCALYIFIRETVSPQSPAAALARLKKTCNRTMTRLPSL